MATNLELERQIADLRKRLDELPSVPKPLQKVSLMDDTQFGTLAHGDVPVWSTTQHKFVNRPAGGVVSSYYNGGSPVTTPVATATLTNLDWPTLSIGPAVLDLSTIDTPTTVRAGEYTFNVTVAVSAGEAPGESVLVVVRISDGTTPYGADVTATVLGNATHDCVVSISHTAVVAAGSTVEVAALQSSGGTVDVRFDQVAVTGP